MTPTLSVVVPMMNEEENVVPLLDEIVLATKNLPLKEIIFVNDGSTDKTLSIMRHAKERVPLLRIVNHAKRSGQSAGIVTGVRVATGDVIVTLDGDGQNDPADIPKLFSAYTTSTVPCLVAGQRKKREDNALRKISSRVANNVRSAILRDKVRDTGCGLKLFPRDAFLRIPAFNHMHRYIPALMQRENVPVLLVDVHHRPRERGTSKYGVWNRLWVGIVDLFGVWWLIRRGPNNQNTITEE